MQIRIRLLVFVLILLPSIEIGALARASDWDPRFELPKVSGEIYAVSEFQDDLYVAGYFTALGHRSFSSIARWDGRDWYSMGPEASSGVSIETYVEEAEGVVHELLSWNGFLVTAGAYDFAGGESIQNLAAWDGAAWHDLAYPRSLPVYSLGEWQGNLVAGLSVAMSELDDPVAHQYDGSVWTEIPMPPGIERAYVRAIHESLGTLWLGGRFEPIGANRQDALALVGWDGFSWTIPGGGLRSELAPDSFFVPNGLQGVSDLATIGSVLVAAGSFRLPSRDIEGLAYLSGAEWKPFDVSYYSQPITGVGVELLSIGGRFFAMGDLVRELTGQGVILSASLEELNWSRPQLEPLGPYRLNSIRSYDNLVLSGGSYQGGLIIGRDSFIDRTRRTHSLSLARWSSGTWSSPLPGEGVGGEVEALIEHEGRLIAGGSFEWAGGVYSPRVAAWNGESWEAIGVGLPEGNTHPLHASTVRALYSHEGLVFAGGSFREPFYSGYGQPSAFLATWDGVQWQFLLTDYEEQELDSIDENSGVHAFAVFQDKLFIGGQFYSPEQEHHWPELQGYQGLVYWEDGEIHVFDQSLSGSPTDRIEALVVDDGRLIAGGRFTRIGGVVVAGLAAYDGVGWMPLDGWDYGFATDLLVNGDGLYVQRREEAVGGDSCCEILSLWTGEEWLSLPRPRSSDDPSIWPRVEGDALISINGTLVGGRNRLYRRQDEEWKPLSFEFVFDRWHHRWPLLGMNASGHANQLLVDGDRVWVAGWFDHVLEPSQAVEGGYDWLAASNLTNADLRSIVPPTATIAIRDPRDPVGFQPVPPPTGILGNYPNPFNPRTVLRFALANEGWAQIDIVAVNGRVVRSFAVEQLAAGEHELVWNGADESGRAVASGVYFARLSTPEGAHAHRMALVR